MGKGRKQGGGPAIALKKKKGKTEAQRSAERRVAALSRAAATRKKRPTIVANRQRERFLEQIAAGTPRTPVFARAESDGEWLEVGHVSCAMDATTTVEQAARLHKRIILEHAVRAHATLLRLQQQGERLECGLGPMMHEGAEDEAAEEAAATSDAEVVPLAPADKGEALAPAAALALAATCGFLGRPLAGGHYYGDSGTAAVATDARKVKLTRLGNDAKSAIAEQQSKALSLRSLG